MVSRANFAWLVAPEGGKPLGVVDDIVYHSSTLPFREIKL